MKASLIILSIFIAGLLTGAIFNLPGQLYLSSISNYVLYALMFLVGISIGCDKHVWQQFGNMKVRILLIPLSAIVGTGLGMMLFNLIFSYPNAKDVYAVGAGLGYYSLSSIFISKMSGETLGVIALLSNIIREVGTLVLTPVLVKYFGKLAPISSGGATTSDTTLPIIMQYSGKEYVLGAVLNGIVLTLLVPFLISFIYSC